MRHDVIMPALGMAQETGLIVAWLKKPGEAVKAGEALMEVETDKATMEVEAGADGFLADVRAAEGDNIPVGDVVAIIADSPDATGTAAPEPTDAPARQAERDGKLPVGHGVIMPALGMAQDSGVIVAWHVDPGAQVAEGDALMEVETDKATMEVEADRAGFVAAILAEEGDDVPVGQVVAILSDSAPDAPIRRAMAQAPAPDRPAPAAETRAADPEPGPAPTKATPPAARVDQGRPGGPVLASPKARRLAAAEGLDLADLAKAGHPQPFHVADLDALRELSRARPAAAAASAPVAMPSVLIAEIPAQGWDGFRAWHGADSGAAVPSERMLAAFVTGALRAAISDEGRVTIAVATTGDATPVANADRMPLTADLPEAETGAAPSLLLRDLTGTAISAMRPGAPAQPLLTLTRKGDMLVLHLSHDAADLSETAALALLDGLAARLADPRRQLL